ncbi:MAG: gliding motility-associated ABC transporter permease subunit GldF [Bacteroidales bacterium]|nr:gliding motility-associated ABC transporter permease subunit GldF [Bacteroidales bacterium]
MIALFRKELASFFSSLIGYLVLIVFLIATGLFLFAFDGNFNIINSGYANIDGLFILAPWIFLFLIPAISMRFFCEESKSGTIELLLTMPISDFSIVMGKFLAGVVLLFFALAPTSLYYITVFSLGSPVGNIDTAATIGAYIGLFFLGGMYLSIGTFVSSLTDNQIVAFILTAAICFIFFIGFDFIAETIPHFSFLTSIGINEHYNSISRGVIDSRDIVYFVSLISLFIYFTTLSIAKKRK